MIEAVDQGVLESVPFGETDYVDLAPTIGVEIANTHAAEGVEGLRDLGPPDDPAVRIRTLRVVDSPHPVDARINAGEALLRREQGEDALQREETDRASAGEDETALPNPEAHSGYHRNGS